MAGSKEIRAQYSPSGEMELKKPPIDFRFRFKSISPLIETGDFDDAEFYGACDDFDGNKGRWPLEIEEDLKGRDRELWIFNEDTGVWGDSQMTYGRLWEDLERK